MKKILSFFCVILVYSNTAAQVTISRSELVGTKWVTSEDYESHSSLDYATDLVFTKDAIIVHNEHGSTYRKPFYLSNTIPTKFDLKRLVSVLKGVIIMNTLTKNISVAGPS